MKDYADDPVSLGLAVALGLSPLASRPRAPLAFKYGPFRNRPERATMTKQKAQRLARRAARRARK